LYSKILILRFRKDDAQKPVVCYLAKDFGLTFSILRATVLPRKEGVMVLDLSGPNKEQFEKGVQFLKDHGVDVKNAAQEIIRDEEKCIHCGACTAVCPTGALSIKRPEMRIIFDQSKCIVCQLCVPTCPPRAMVVQSINEQFFE
jgi:ferredoxin